MTRCSTESASAKINLYLHVVGKRGDGYHLLDSLVVFAECGDRLHGADADNLSLTVTGRFAAGLAPEGLMPGSDNLVLRAARALAAMAGIRPRVTLTLEKNLPVAAGIGGGSADAAATLRLLCRLWDLAPDDASLMHLASGLGADVPVCLVSRPRRMSGAGEQLAPAPSLPSCGIVLVNPGVAVSTGDVFRGRHAPFSSPADLPSGWRDADAMAIDLERLTNDLEAPAVSLCPSISAVLAALRAHPACRLARMSGSGATCFGLFPSAAVARQAAAALSRHDWWVWGGSLRQD